MQINVSQLLKEPVGSTRSFNMDETAEVSDGVRVRGEVRLVRTDRGILAQGKLHTEVELTCSRCLSLFTSPLVLDIEEEYYPTTDVFSGAPLTLPEDSGGFPIDGHHIIDMTEAVRQYILLTTPMKPLCREDCAGLCPVCGHNLNQGPCSCPPQGVDPHWAKLYSQARSYQDASADGQKERE